MSFRHDFLTPFIDCQFVTSHRIHVCTFMPPIHLYTFIYSKSTVYVLLVTILHMLVRLLLLLAQ